MLGLKFNMGGLTEQLDQLEAGIAGGIRVAAQAGAQVYYDEMKIRAAQSEKGTGKGLLARSIYQKYVKEASTPGKSATYHISWNKGRGTATPFAGHGHLVEYGWLQRYVMAKDENGNFMGPAVRAGMEGKPKPKRHTPQAIKDAYWVTLPTPIQHAPRSFLRATYDAKKDAALEAGVVAMHDYILKGMV